MVAAPLRKFLCEYGAPLMVATAQQGKSAKSSRSLGAAHGRQWECELLPVSHCQSVFRPRSQRLLAIPAR